MKFKKLISAALISTISLGGVVGCGKKEEPKPQTQEFTRDNALAKLNTILENTKSAKATFGLEASMTSYEWDGKNVKSNSQSLEYEDLEVIVASNGIQITIKDESFKIFKTKKTVDGKEEDVYYSVNKYKGDLGKEVTDVKEITSGYYDAYNKYSFKYKDEIYKLLDFSKNNDNTLTFEYDVDLSDKLNSLIEKIMYMFEGYSVEGSEEVKYHTIAEYLTKYHPEYKLAYKGENNNDNKYIYDIIDNFFNNLNKEGKDPTLSDLLTYISDKVGIDIENSIIRILTLVSGGDSAELLKEMFKTNLKTTLAEAVDMCEVEENTSEEQVVGTGEEQVESTGEKQEKVCKVKDEFKYSDAIKTLIQRSFKQEVGSGEEVEYVYPEIGDLTVMDFVTRYANNEADGENFYGDEEARKEFINGKINEIFTTVLELGNYKFEEVSLEAELVTNDSMSMFESLEVSGNISIKRKVESEDKTVKFVDFIKLSADFDFAFTSYDKELELTEAENAILKASLESESAI